MELIISAEMAQVRAFDYEKVSSSFLSITAPKLRSKSPSITFFAP